MKKLILISALLMMSIFLFGCTVQNPNIEPRSNPDGVVSVEGKAALAQCLTEKGVIMYGTEWCSHCQAQKAAFGSAFEYIDFVDCDQDSKQCRSVGIQGYPTWSIGGELFPGGKELSTLAGLAGCEFE